MISTRLIAGLLLAIAAWAQVAILQVRVVEGEGAVHVPGARSSRPLTVEITDETGKPVPGAAVSFHLPEDGASGTFVNGLRTEVAITDTHGRATLHGLQVNRVPGRFQIRILASKEQARAGTVSFQYVAEPKSGAATPASSPKASSPGSALNRKWLWAALAVAGGAAAALAAPHGSSATNSAAISAAAISAAAVPPPVVAPSVSIGAPTITVGRP